MRAKLLASVVSKPKIVRFRHIVCQVSLTHSLPETVFNIQLGNIHAREKISVHISYAVELPADSARHTVRFHLPINVIPRYGTPPGGAQSSPSPSSPLDLSVDVVQPSPIRSITCPSSHPIQIKLEQPVEHVHGLLHRAKITLGPSADISKDVILVTEADELDKPSCLLQSPTATGVSGQVALGLTLVPNFKLQDYSSGTDFIFVVDRSGSMGQGSMALAKNALQISLRSLPTRNTSFNIVSFGSTADRCFTFPTRLCDYDN